MSITVRQADLANADDANSILTILNSYATDLYGGGTPLSEDVQQRLIPALQTHPTTIVFLAFWGHKAVGLATCFLGFSTFRAKNLLNIHDLAVLPDYRQKGIGRSILYAIEDLAVKRGCCKLTLEVLDDNLKAIKLYEKHGFSNYSLGDSNSTRFLTKSISDS